MTATRILFVSANPTSTPKLELADELRRFQHALTGHAVKLMLLPAAQPEDLKIAMESRNFDVVHFTGHADERGILMRNARGIEELLPRQELRELFQGKGVKLAVLNACNTKASAEDIEESVDTVIGTSDVIDQRAGRMLTKVFYSALGRGSSVKDAYIETIDTINKYAPEKNVLMGRGLDNEASLFPKGERAGGDVELEGQEPFDRYYYVDYLDKQIASYRLNRNANLVVLAALLGLGIAIICWFWLRDMAEAVNAATPVAASLEAGGFQACADAVLEEAGKQGFLSWIWDELKMLVTESRSDTPLLDWLATIGQAIPLFMTTMQARWCVHSAEKIRQLTALRKLVRDSENLTQDLRIRLHKIMDQSLQAAEEPTWFATVAGSVYKRTRPALVSLYGKVKSALSNFFGKKNTSNEIKEV